MPRAIRHKWIVKCFRVGGWVDTRNGAEADRPSMAKNDTSGANSTGGNLKRAARCRKRKCGHQLTLHLFGELRAKLLFADHRVAQQLLIMGYCPLGPGKLLPERANLGLHL